MPNTMSRIRSTIIVLIAAVQLVLLPASSMAWGSDCGEGTVAGSCCCASEAPVSACGCCADGSSGGATSDAEGRTNQDTVGSPGCSCRSMPSVPPVPGGGASKAAETIQHWIQFERRHARQGIDRSHAPHAAVCWGGSDRPAREGPTLPMLQVFRL